MDSYRYPTAWGSSIRSTDILAGDALRNRAEAFLSKNNNDTVRIDESALKRLEELCYQTASTCGLVEYFLEFALTKKAEEQATYIKTALDIAVRARGLLRQFLSKWIALRAIGTVPAATTAKQCPTDKTDEFKNPSERHPKSRNLLSRREQEIVQYLWKGKGNKEIASLLGLSVKTVQTYRARIMMKLEVHTVADVLRYAVQCRLIED